MGLSGSAGGTGCQSSPVSNEVKPFQHCWDEDGTYQGVERCTCWQGCQSWPCPRENTLGMIWTYDEEELSSEPSQPETVEEGQDIAALMREGESPFGPQRMQPKLTVGGEQPSDGLVGA